MVYLQHYFEGTLRSQLKVITHSLMLLAKMQGLSTPSLLFSSYLYRIRLQRFR